jgi:hypothetical protein
MVISPGEAGFFDFSDGLFAQPHAGSEEAPRSAQAREQCVFEKQCQ